MRKKELKVKKYRNRYELAFLGIWIWSEPIRLSEDHDFDTLIFDMEGISLSGKYFLDKRSNVKRYRERK